MTEQDDDEAVRQGLVALWPRLWCYCVVLTGSPERANDAAQAACVRALEKSSLFEGGTRLDAWVFKIAQRVWLNDLRAETVRKAGGLVALDDIEVADTRPDGESTLFSKEVLNHVMNLPEAQRATVLLVYVEGYTYREAAEILDIPIGTVMSRLSAARAVLSKTLRRDKKAMP